MKTKIADVLKAWTKFLNTYRQFRRDNGLKKGDYNAFEICTSLSDKHGRICRQIKHTERNDSKDDCPNGMTEAMAGYIFYMEMLLDKYGTDMTVGLKNELESAIRQYQKPVEENVDENWCSNV